MICTKAEFNKYLALQERGPINMLDVEQGTKLTGLTKEKYIDCITNYSHYKEKYYGKIRRS